jgi:hypothetical protein
MFSFNSIWIATGLYLSLRVKKVTVAVIVNLMLAVVLYVGVPAVLFILGTLSGLHDRAGKLVGWYLPYYYIINGIVRPSRYEMIGLPFIRDDVSYNAFALITLAVGIFHLLLAWYILSATAQGFDRIVGRAGTAASRLGFGSRAVA